MITKSTTHQYICMHPHMQCYTYCRIVCKWQSKAKWNTLNYSPFKRIRTLFVQFFADIIDLGFKALHDINIWIFFFIKGANIPRQMQTWELFSFFLGGGCHQSPLPIDTWKLWFQIILMTVTYNRKVYPYT